VKSTSQGIRGAPGTRGSGTPGAGRSRAHSRPDTGKGVQ